MQLTGTRIAAFILLIGLLAALFVTFERVRIENATRHVEIAMDYNDFLALARSYNYQPEAFLVALRRAGLTSLALQEELGSSVGTDKNAYVASGVALLATSRLSSISDPTLSALIHAHKIAQDEVYVLVYDRPTFERYMQQLPLHFTRGSIRVLHASAPWVIGIRTQLDYFGSIGLGIPTNQLQLARRLNFLVIPRFQNDERLQQPQIAALFDSIRHRARISTLVFFGLRNQVVGFPDHVKDTADVMRARKLTFGSIETYDPNQIQKGNDELAKLLPGRAVRVQAIAKLEQDKLSFDDILARYLLGTRERNIRVVYLRPFAHQLGTLSIEKTNVELVHRLAQSLRARGFSLGRASPVPLYRGNNRVVVGIAALSVPSIFVLLLFAMRLYRRWLAIAAYALTIVVYAAGLLLHHDLFARSVIALAGALLFAAAAIWLYGGAFTEPPASSSGAQMLRGLYWTALATGVALLGALVVIGLMSSPLVMEEIERFRGVKALLAVPALIALLLYLFTDRFGARIANPRAAFATPVGVGQLILGVLIVVAGALVLTRSGNQTDISPSSFELSLRSGLTSLLSVRPRFKEFLVGFPLMMLTPALILAHRRAIGWLVAIGIGIGIGDVIDTFSHLHTPVVVSLLRVFNGAVIGCVIGALLILIYRAIFRTAQAEA